ncbi:unnamed protein product [Diatraea saccharalis]|uniref:NADH-cytochrome b5 reductase n=1 Tax=Diatraea saccharalis TaxID=40085 RepID=A0A9N9QX36_9NEOP|nr:unnamed protein product [Diatraea saccharalis]
MLYRLRQALLHHLPDKPAIMMEPVEPNKEDCCNSGCNPCIFDVYEKQLLLYKRFLRGDKIVKPVRNAISQLSYAKFSLTKSVKVSNVHKLLLFQQTLLDNNSEVHWNPGDHFLLKYTDDFNNCSRAFSPLKPSLCCDDKHEMENNDFAIIVKKYDNGIVSNYLYNLIPNDITLWRGPYGSFEINLTLNCIIMIAQGTGILPFISIIDKYLDNEDNLTKIILYYCCKNYDEILFRDKLYAYKCYWNFTYKIFLNHHSPDDKPKYLEPIFNHKLRSTNLSELLPLSGNDQFLISGSTLFMSEYQQSIKTLCPVVNIKLF